MTTYLLHDNAVRSHELRHEIGHPVADAVAFIEHDGKRILIGTEMERATFEAREDVIDEYWTYQELGIEELLKDESFSNNLLDTECTVRALAKIGVSSVIVPPSFQIQSADHLRSKGIEVVIDEEAWVERRRK